MVLDAAVASVKSVVEKLDVEKPVLARRPSHLRELSFLDIIAGVPEALEVPMLVGPVTVVSMAM